MTIKLDEAAAAYVKMRDAIATKERELKEFKASLKEKMEMLEAFFMKQFDTIGTDSVSAGGITVFRAMKDSVTISDKEQFRSSLVQQLLDGVELGEDTQSAIEKMMASPAFDLLTLSANKTGCKQFADEHKGLFPEGVQYTQTQTVQLRKGSK